MMMMTLFLDEVTVKIESGAGGNGAVAWHREKYIAFGGPSGGDGGRGGSVYAIATEDLNTLVDFRFISFFKAEDGGKGASKNCHGRGGQELVIKVPIGTVLKDAETGEIFADLSVAGQKELIAQGGRGGRGNARFSTAKNKAPYFSEPGEPPIIRNVTMELKLLADVGLVGLPNAGKSTLISVVSAAKPKIANYPFTTLIPNLGVMRKPNGDGIVIADIPGLIEGAHQGVGLGHDFLRHVERTRLIVHLVDATATDGGTPLGNYNLIQQELKAYSAELIKRPQLLVLTKQDALDEADLAEVIATFNKAYPQLKIYTISAVSKLNLDAFKRTLLEELEKAPKPEAVIVNPTLSDRATNHDDSAFQITKTSAGTYFIEGGKIHRWIEITDMGVPQSLMRFLMVLKALGVFRKLVKMGAKVGDTIEIRDQAFDFEPDEREHPEAYQTDKALADDAQAYQDDLDGDWLLDSDELEESLAETRRLLVPRSVAGKELETAEALDSLAD
jgi:GTP-binding protein